MRQNVEYQLFCEIEKERPHLQIGFRFMDYFETNDYCLVSEDYKYGSYDNIAFNVFKDDEKIGRVYLKEGDVSGLIDDFMTLTKDHDFNKIFLAEHRTNAEQDVNNFFSHFRKTIVENKFTLEGEMKRMRAVAGII